MLLVTWHVLGPFFVAENSRKKTKPTPTTLPSHSQAFSSYIQLWPTSRFFKECPQNTVQQQLLEQPNKICKSLQSFSLLVKLGMWTFWWELFDPQYTEMWPSTVFLFRASQFTQVIRKHVSHPRVIGLILKHFTRWQLWSKPAEVIYSIPILSQQRTDAYPSRAWHLLIVSNVDAREFGDCC